MKIDADLRLTFPVRWSENVDEKGNPVPLIWAYHAPISKAVFEANWRIISATAATLLRPGVAPSVISVARLALIDASRADAASYGLPEGSPSYEEGGSAVTLLGELQRSTTILFPGPAAYEMIPADQAIKRGIIDADDWSEAENALVFFTCGFSAASRQQRIKTAPLLALALGGSMTSSPLMEFAASLSASMPAAPSAEAGSSVPS